MQFAHKKIEIECLPFYGLSEAGKISPGVLRSILSRIKANAAELMVHPGYDSDDNPTYYPSPPVHCKRELDVLTNDLHPLLNQYNIEIVRRSAIFGHA